MAARQGRAAPMSPAHRRDALVEVFLDLAHREGRRPTTSEIAREAGVAEGTIYRAFATKEELEQEAIDVAFCPGPVRRSVEQIEGTSLRGRLVGFTTILQRRFTEVFGLMAALGLTEPPRRGGHAACYEAGRHLPGADSGDVHDPAVHQVMIEALQQSVLDGAHDDDRAGLDVSPRDLVHRLRLLTFSGSHPGIAEGRVLSPEEIVDTVLYGTVRRSDGCCARGPAQGPAHGHDPSSERPKTR
ncbi:MAG: helix-turn-helix domain-containing protein [Terracoccus sp.]